MENYKQFIISFKPFAVELVSGILWELAIEGIAENDNYLDVFTKESSGLTKENINKLLQHAVVENLIESFEINESIVENKNWNEEWEKNVNIVHVTDKIIIKPSFKNYTPKEGQIVITIDPKMSFGTGEHQTTKLVLSLCEKFINKGDKVLDVGSGTGVLAIASVMLGAKRAIGFDNDEWCKLNGDENIQLNNIGDRVEFRLAEIADIKEHDFDMVLANINKHILLDIKTDLRRKLKPGGKLILSGLLIQDEQDINKSYLPLGFKLLDKFTMDEWIALVYETA